MNIDILIATYNDGICNLENILLPFQDDLSYKVAHQVTNGKNYHKEYQKYSHRDDVIIKQFLDKGLSKNRNHLLQMADAQICLIMDDDVVLVPKIASIISKAFEQNPVADIITFQTISKSRAKRYKDVSFSHTIKTLTQVSSIEVAFRLSSIKKNSLVFDTNFGIGAKYEIGEEFIFLVDAYKRGLHLLYMPQAIAKHEDESSGYSLSNKILYARGAVYMRVFGLKAIILYFYSTIKHFDRYKSYYTPWRYFYILLQGGLSYVKENKNA
jgi:glycosyltransferase involved in cell wall biosynthesis